VAGSTYGLSATPDDSAVRHGWIGEQLFGVNALCVDVELEGLVNVDDRNAGVALFPMASPCSG
jgi:hypothetical protein